VSSRYALINAACPGGEDGVLKAPGQQ